MKMYLGQHSILRTVGMTAIFVSALASCCLYSTLLEAGEVVKLAISDKQDVYQLELEMILDAPYEDVHYVITDYVHIYRINPSIVESDILYTPDPSVTRVRTLINDCVLFFCRNILRVEDVREFRTGDIYAVIVPRLSNVKSGTAHWQIQPLGARTRINYNLTLELGFFIPPLIGSHIVKMKLQEETLISFSNIERIAQIREEQEKARKPTLKETRPGSTDGGHDNAN
jgi:hypothetical protein